MYIDDENDDLFIDNDEVDNGDSYTYESEPIYFNELSEDYPQLDYDIDVDNAEYEKTAYRNDLK